MTIQFAKLAVALLAVSTYASASAAMFRWVDENGNTHYSQRPPATGDAVELKKQSAPSAEDARAAQERLRRQREQAFDEAEAQREAESEQSKRADEESLRAANCTAARENLQKFQNLGPRRIRAPDGRYLRLSEDQVQMQIEKAQHQVEENCK